MLPGQIGRNATLAPGRQTVELCLGTVATAVKGVVRYGTGHRDLDVITHIGIDEISRKKGQVYLANVYDLRSKP